MSAGLAVGWQVSFLNKFCWIWSSGVAINTLKFSWMNRTCDVSKVFSQIESLQVDIKSLQCRKESFWSIIRFEINNPSSQQRYTWTSLEILHSGSHVTPKSWRSSDRIPPESHSCSPPQVSIRSFFWGNPNIIFWPKNQEISQKHSWWYATQH